VLPDGTAAAIRDAHRGFERARSRVWLERIRVGLEYRRGLREIEEGVAAARRERDGRVREAVAAGASYREVARAVGLSHSRIQQIVNEGGGHAEGKGGR
jgi:DNA invertase Pin-like site-specific DNA recombinase